jgi:hypothetical protein
MAWLLAPEKQTTDRRTDLDRIIVRNIIMDKQHLSAVIDCLRLTTDTVTFIEEKTRGQRNASLWHTIEVTD